MTKLEKFIYYLVKDLKWLEKINHECYHTIKAIIISNIQAFVDELENTKVGKIIEEEYEKFRKIDWRNEDEDRPYKEEEIWEAFLDCDDCWNRILQKILFLKDKNKWK